MNGGDRSSARELQLVVLRLGQEAYGVDIARVREVIALPPITRLPGAPGFVEGILNLRGNVVPVMDLRERLGMARAPVTRETRVMIVEIAGRTLGLVVDAVVEVLRVGASAVEPPHEMAEGFGATLLEGVARLQDRLVILLDLERLLWSPGQEEGERHARTGVLEQEMPGGVAAWPTQRG